MSSRMCDARRDPVSALFFFFFFLYGVGYQGDTRQPAEVDHRSTPKSSSRHADNFAPLLCGSLLHLHYIIKHTYIVGHSATQRGHRHGCDTLQPPSRHIGDALACLAELGRSPIDVPNGCPTCRYLVGKRRDEARRSLPMPTRTFLHVGLVLPVCLGTYVRTM